MVARVNTDAFRGIEVLDIDVQVQIAGWLVTFRVVGLPDKAMTAARRVIVSPGDEPYSCVARPDGQEK